MLGWETDWRVLIFYFAAVLVGYYIVRIDRRLKAIDTRLARLSLTYQKIETDLNAIQDSVFVLSSGSDEEIHDTIAKIRAGRHVLFRQILENGPDGSEILRGLEWPDFKDDPVFWKGNLADRMKLPKTISEVDPDLVGK